MKIQYDGEEYDIPNVEMHKISDKVWIMRAGNSAYEFYAYKTPKTHEFGGVVFEETGEVRKAVGGEYFWGSSKEIQIWTSPGLTKMDYPILKPVKIIWANPS